MNLRPDEDDVVDETEEDARPASWRTGNRTILVLAAVAVASLVAGLVLSRFVVNPAQAAADAAPSAAGPITVPVESRQLSNDVLLRGDAVYDDAVDLSIETGELSGRAVVTGQVPEVGATFDAGSVALEIAGRPVIVLPGELSTYRTLRPGVSGPDVLQLKAALAALGIDAGDLGSDAYDAKTAAGVRALYERAGYSAPVPTREETEAVRMAQQQVRQAQSEVDSARSALGKAGSSAQRSARVEAEAAVRSAQQSLADAKQACEAPSPEGPPCSQADVVRAQGEIDVAVARRDELNAAPDTSAERSAVTAAEQMLADARAELATAQEATMTVLPASEIVYLASLPRRVDAISTKRGATLEGSAMKVSGATLEIDATAVRTDADLLAVGAQGTVTLKGEEIPVTVVDIAASTPDSGSGDDDSGSGADSSSGRMKVTMHPGELTPEQVGALQGQNVRVKIPVSSTGGEVLAVPLAALTAGPGGESRIELLGDDGTNELVEVTTGLAAGGFVEVTGVARELKAGDLVVVGDGGSGSATSDGDDG